MAARHDTQEDPVCVWRTRDCTWPLPMTCLDKTNDHFCTQSDAGSVGLPDFGDNIDQMTFEQILEMDDDEDERDFSKSIVFGFFEQAEATFKKMDACL